MILRPPRLFAALALGLCLGQPARAADTADTVTPPRPVVAQLITSKTSALPSYVGTVAARIEVRLGFPLSGTLAARPVDVGDTVAKGQLLAQLDPEKIDADVWAARAGVIVARQGVDSALDAMQRTRELVARQVEGQARLEEAERDLAGARARLEQARATLARAQDVRASATLHAPQDGIITAVFVEAGAAVSAGQPIVRLAGTKGREIIVDLTDRDIRRLPADAIFDTHLLAMPEITASARLASVDPVAERATRTRGVHLSLERLPATYRLGALIRVTPRGSPESRITLPASALLDTPQGRFVWRITRGADPARGQIAKTLVKTAPAPANRVFILSGLKDGDEVLLKGIHSVHEGEIIGPRVAK